MDLNLTKNATAITELATFYNVTRTHPNPVVHVIGVEKVKRHIYKLLLSDGLYYHDAYVDCTLKRSKQLQKGSIVRLTEYLRAIVVNTTVIKVLDVTVIGTKCHIFGHPKPFPYSATPSVEDYCLDSLSENEDTLSEGSYVSVEEQLESGSETEDGFILLEEGFDY